MKETTENCRKDYTDEKKMQENIPDSVDWEDLSTLPPKYAEMNEKDPSQGHTFENFQNTMCKIKSDY